MKWFKRYLLLISFTISCFSISAQLKTGWADSFLNARIHYGFQASHKSYTKYMTTAHFTAFEISLVNRTSDMGTWRKLYGFPDIGLSYWYSNMGHSTYTGWTQAIYPYISFPIRQKKIMHSLRMGFGIGYIQKTFDLYENYKNIMIGSHINNCTNFHYEVSVPVKKIQLSAGIGITHFSNGALRMPNLGINIPTVSLGIKFKEYKIITAQKDSIPIIDKNKNEVFAAFGLIDHSPENSTLYSFASLSYDRVLYRNAKTGFSVGGDLFYNETNPLRLKAIHEENIGGSEVRGGLHSSFYLYLSRFVFTTQMGAYLFNRVKNDGTLYHRFGWYFKLNKDLLVKMTLKTHFAKAECIEWGVGYKF